MKQSKKHNNIPNPRTILRVFLLNGGEQICEYCTNLTIRRLTKGMEWSLTDLGNIHVCSAMFNNRKPKAKRFLHMDLLTF